MIVEVERFVEFMDGFWSNQTRERMLFTPMIINTEYIATIKRLPTIAGIEFCEVSMADYGRAFTVAKTYEEMRDLLKGRP
jgi:hypothetical protein